MAQKKKKKAFSSKGHNLRLYIYDYYLIQL